MYGPIASATSYASSTVARRFGHLVIAGEAGVALRVARTAFDADFLQLLDPLFIGLVRLAHGEYFRWISLYVNSPAHRRKFY
ncbi:hypothetical protein CFBP8129_46970 (plasmid) [Xanthomonas hortorum pv. gardneri]|uniref:Uncharacterized protein n=1 Tax=Xanthomonas hortorum pv. gardneri TaxID=2754056 RepID=A0A6V7FIN7_9XANT|nr:hypothetical protein CFBP8129_46970 [Xanthomonas hortorum pv. gardneri]CAD0363178.1 hypothetical protein CFBP8129_46970 [Xanthomonas hortorum pv. gardneri]